MDAIAEAVEQASPGLARQVAAMCSAAEGSTADTDARRVRRVVLSMVRYVLRMSGRATPFGLFAGVAPTVFGDRAMVAWGDGHRAFARADARWISEVIDRLEACPDLLRRLPLVANSTAFIRGDRLVVPYPPRSRRPDRASPAEVSLRFTAAVQIVWEAARAPVGFDALRAKLAAEFPEVTAARVTGLITSLMDQGVLLSSLTAPFTTLDALGHLVDQAEMVRGHQVPQSADLVGQLRQIRDDLAEHNRAADPATGHRLRSALREKMIALSTAADQPVIVDLRLDCSLVLPPQVAREAEAATSVLARLTAFPFGTPGWKSYHNRFFERYGIGSLVPLRDVVDPDVGLGFPNDYLDCEPEPREPVTEREQRLLALAQEAAVDGRAEVVLDERLITELTVGDHSEMQVPPHLELRFQLHACTPTALTRGEFGLTVISASRGVGTTTGRLIGLLEHGDQGRAASVFKRLPGSDSGSLPVQISFPPLDCGDANVARAPQLLAATISLAEHRPPDPHTIELDDLAVGCDRRRLYLASLSRKQRLDATILHALDLRAHTPPLARFLAEISRGQAAVVTNFAWGAAGQLPYLPRLRYGRTVLSPARWRLHRSQLPDRRAPWGRWKQQVSRWRARWHVPDAVALTEGDQLLRLDLAHDAHLAVLRMHLTSAPFAVLTEARVDDGWFQGHAHEIVVPMTAAHAARWSKVPPVTGTRLVDRDHGHLPGASGWLLAKLYAHVDRHAELVGRHFADLFSRWEEPPTWWFMRYRDPRWHLRLRIALPDATQFGTCAGHVSAWAARLRRRGLLGEVQFATSYTEPGRWGSGPVMDAAEEVFAADSRVLAVQFAQSLRLHPQALAAANFVSIAAAFTGSTQHGMDWLTTYGKITDPRPMNREVLDQAVRLADPARGWEALRAAPGGAAVLDVWKDRDRALSCYRTRLRQAGDHTERDAVGVDPDLVLDSLLHAHHIRATAIAKDDERTCVRLARAAALAWTARRK